MEKARDARAYINIIKSKYIINNARPFEWRIHVALPDYIYIKDTINNYVTESNIYWISDYIKTESVKRQTQIREKKMT